MAKRKKKTARQLIAKRLEDLCRKLVARRDKYKCQKCGVDLRAGGRHVHHIRERARSILLMWDLLNLILFCRDCHCWATHDAVGADRWLAENFPHMHKYQWEVIECPKTGREMPRRNCLKSWKADELKAMEADYKEQLKNWNDLETY